MIRVLIADDHAVVRRGIEQLVAAEADLEVVGAVADGAQAVDAVARLAPDVVLMDISMPVRDGIEATRQIVAAHPGVRVVMLTSFADQRKVVDAIGAGASGYLLKDGDPDDVAAAVRAAHAGDAPLDPKAARLLIDAQRQATSGAAGGGPKGTPAGRELSAREQEVLLLVVEGLANKQIARRLGIAERTVKAHLTAVFQQLGVTDRTQAALWAREHLSPPA